jgi:hypothetical protein
MRHRADDQIACGSLLRWVKAVGLPVNQKAGDCSYCAPSNQIIQSDNFSQVKVVDMYGLSGHFTNEERDIQRKLRVLQHAEKIGNQTSAEIVEKVPLVC